MVMTLSKTDGWNRDEIASLKVVGCAKYPVSFKVELVEMPTNLSLFVKTDPVKVGLLIFAFNPKDVSTWVFV